MFYQKHFHVLLRRNGKTVLRALCKGKKLRRGAGRPMAPWSLETPTPPEVRRPRPTEVILQRGGALQSPGGRWLLGVGPLIPASRSSPTMPL